jgi:hypothetical protein
MRKLLVALAIVGVLALLLSIPAQAQAPYEFYLTIQGEKQGNFRGESLRKGTEGKIPGVRFQYAVTIPTDPNQAWPAGSADTSPLSSPKSGAFPRRSSFRHV